MLMSVVRFATRKLPLEAVWTSEVCAANKNDVDPWSMLLLAVTDRKASFAVVLMTAKLRMRDIEGFCGNPPPQRKETVQTKVLKNCDKVVSGVCVSGDPLHIYYGFQASVFMGFLSVQTVSHGSSLKKNTKNSYYFIIMANYEPNALI
ncbi:hypothetical protein H671_1g0292 [Cricetulus griseus]|nr:hypothetical protein H671_1g0292 [Cricetulus griseus]